MKTRFVSFANNTVAIDYEEAVGQQFIDFLFADIGDKLDDRKDREPLSRFTISRQAESEEMRLQQNNSNLYKGRCDASLANTLVEVAMHKLVDKNDTGLAIHAAAVAKGDKGILIPGVSGAGKSTMSAWLTNKGFIYLTDELVNIPLDSSVIEGFTRPINIKKVGRRLLRKHFNIRARDSAVMSNDRVSMVPHRLLNPAYVAVSPRVDLILFPNIIRDEKQRIERLSKAETVLILVKCLVNGRNLANHGFDQLTRLARQAPAYRLYYRGFKQLPTLLSDIVPGLG